MINEELYKTYISALKNIEPKTAKQFTDIMYGGLRTPNGNPIEDIDTLCTLTKDQLIEQKVPEEIANNIESALAKKERSFIECKTSLIGQIIQEQEKRYFSANGKRVYETRGTRGKFYPLEKIREAFKLYLKGEHGYHQIKEITGVPYSILRTRLKQINLFKKGRRSAPKTHIPKVIMTERDAIDRYFALQKVESANSLTERDAIDLFTKKYGQLTQEDVIRKHKILSKAQKPKIPTQREIILKHILQQRNP